MAGLLTRPSVRFTVATSPSFVSRPYWAAITSYPSAWSAGITLLKHEPSAQIPWQKTMLGLVCVDLFILEPPWRQLWEPLESPTGAISTEVRMGTFLTRHDKLNQNRPPPLDHVNNFRHNCRYQRRAAPVVIHIDRNALFTSIGTLYSHRRNTQPQLQDGQRPIKTSAGRAVGDGTRQTRRDCQREGLAAGAG